MSHGDSYINDNFKIVFLNIYVITNTFIPLLKLIVVFQSCMNVYINIIVMVNIFLENMNVITDIYRSFSFFFLKTYVYIFLVSNSTHARNNTQSCHQIWKAKNAKRVFLTIFSRTCHNGHL